MNKYTPYERQIATEIATELNDLESLGMHLSYVRHYEEWSLRKELKKVMSYPDHKIDVSRGAYYNSLVQQNGVRKGHRD